MEPAQVVRPFEDLEIPELIESHKLGSLVLNGLFVNTDGIRDFTLNNLDILLCGLSFIVPVD
jgi:hypothetical protein